MCIDVEKSRNNWKSVLELKQIEIDISGLGYSKEFIKKNSLLEKKSQRLVDYDGVINFSEPIEVKQIDGSVFYREVESYHCKKIPKVFETQYGKFNNHNNGEFPSWLGKENYAGLPKKEREMHSLFGREDYYIEGNFCDMFDCGQYTYAVSDLQHMAVGRFKIVRIDNNLEATVLYENSLERKEIKFEYHGRVENELGYIVIASGLTVIDDKESKEKMNIYKTMVFQINYNGNWNLTKKWEIKIPTSSSVALCGNKLYFGHNKMVTRLDTNTGEFAYFTNKSDEELAALNNIRKL